MDAAHLINRTPTQILHGKTPYEVLFGAEPSFTHIRVFGCLCYAYNMQRKKDKFGARSKGASWLNILMERKVGKYMT